MKKSQKNLNLKEKKSQHSEKRYKTVNLCDKKSLPSDKIALRVSSSVLSESNMTVLVVY